MLSPVALSRWLRTSKTDTRKPSRKLHIESLEARDVPANVWVGTPITDAVSSEPGTSAQTGSFNLRRDGSFAQPLTANLQFTGTATAGTDYALTANSQTITQTVTFPAGTGLVAVTLTPINDTLAEGSETAVVEVAPATSGQYTVGATPTASVTINDDEPSVRVSSVPDAVAGENGTTASFVVARTGPTASSLEVPITITGTATLGSDFTLKAGNWTVIDKVTIPAGAANVTVTLTAVDDALGEGQETAIVTLGATATHWVDNPKSAMLTINDDEATVTITAPDAVAGEGGSTGQFVVTRTGATTAALAVALNLSGNATLGVDYTLAAPGQPNIGSTVTIPAGTPSVTITLTVLEDPHYDPNEKAVAQIGLAPTGNYAVGTASTATVTINDNDPFQTPQVWVSAVPDDLAVEDGDGAYFELTRNGDTSQPLSVGFDLTGTATQGVDYGLASNAGEFPAGQATIRFAIAALPDALTEPTETVIATIRPSAGGAYTIGSSGSGTLRIADGASGPVSYAQVGDKVWHDLDEDGTQDTNEPGVANVFVQVEHHKNGDWVPGASTYTGLDGSYLLQFWPLDADAHRVKVDIRDGFEATDDNAIPLDDEFDSDIDAEGYTAPFTANLYHYDMSLDFGLTGSGSGSGSPENDAPVITAPSSKMVYQGSTLLFTELGEALRVDDVDAGETSIAVGLTASAGTLTLSRIEGLIFSQGDGLNDPAVMFTGTLADVNAALDGLRYVAPSDPQAGVTLTVLANDLGNTGTGGPKTDTETVTIDVVANPYVNLIADNNVDGAMNAEDDAIENDEIGKLVFVNADDDDVSLVPDGQDAGAVAGEDDLAQVKLNIPAGFDGMTARLTVTGDTTAVRLWSTPYRSGLLGSVQSYLIGQDAVPESVYLEGLAVGVVTLRLEVLDQTGAIVYRDGTLSSSEMKARVAKFELDANHNYIGGEAGEGFWDYMPGYQGTTPVLQGTTPELSSSAFSTHSPLKPQLLHAILDGLGANVGVSKVQASLNNISAHKGYAENEPDPADGTFGDMDDVSFRGDEQKTRTDSDADGGVAADMAWIDFFVRDYAASANINVTVYVDGKPRGQHGRQVVRDGDTDLLQDGWEADQSVDEWVAQYGYSFPDRMKAFSGNSSSWNEPKDPDEGNVDGGRNLGAHKENGDSLDVFQEYRGFILDGGGFDGAGQNGHAGGHKRLSPAYKELLIEVDAMPKTNVPAMPMAAGLKSVMETVSKGFSDQTNGAGVRVYWVMDELSAAPNVLTSDADAQAWANTQRNKKHLSEFVHLMFTSDIVGNNLYGVTYNQAGSSGGCFVFPTKIATIPPAADFVAHMANTAAHELTHAIIQATNQPGFSAGEHELNPDPADGDEGPLDLKYLMIQGSIRTPRNQILFSDLVIGQIDLTKKESVEM